MVPCVKGEFSIIEFQVASYARLPDGQGLRVMS